MSDGKDVKLGYMVIPGVANLLEQQLLRACDVVGVEVEEVKGRDAHRLLVLARQLYYWLARRHTSCSCEEIGRLVGRNRTTVIYHIKQIEGLIAVNDPLLMKYISRL